MEDLSWDVVKYYYQHDFMKNKIIYLYICITLFSTARIFADDSSVINSATNSSVKSVDQSAKKHDLEAQELYLQALNLYKSKSYEEAKKKFEEVALVIPNFKSTTKYLNRIDNAIQHEKQRLAEEQQKALDKAQAEALRQKRLAQKEQEIKREHDLKDQESQHKKELEEHKRLMEKAQEEAEQLRLKKLEDQREQAKVLKDKKSHADKIYAQAIRLYRDQQYEAAKKEFLSAQEIIANYKLSNSYLNKIDKRIKEMQLEDQHRKELAAQRLRDEKLKEDRNNQARNMKVNPPDSTVKPSIVQVKVTPPANKSAVVKSSDPIKEQQKQAEQIAELANNSAILYRQIADIADDRETFQTKKKIAKVDRVLNDLKEKKERLLTQMLAEQQRRHDQERRAEAQELYSEGQSFLRSNDYANAKIKFLGVEDIIPDYKFTRSYLSSIEDEQKQAGIRIIMEDKERKVQYLKDLKDKEAAEIQRHAQEERERLEGQQSALKQLAQKASDINDEIIRLSKIQDFEKIKEKFAELENTVVALKTLKDIINKEKRVQESEKQPIENSVIVSSKRHVTVVPVSSAHPSDIDVLKHRDMVKEQNALFKEGVDRYEHRKFVQAKILFDELDQQQDARAKAWLKKVDRAITRDLLKNEAADEKERSSYLSDQLKAQRQLLVIQESERQRQKKLAEELERQKRLFEDNHSFELRKEETLKIQERERQQQEEKQSILSKETSKQEEMYRFHKIKFTPKPALKPTVVKTKAILNPKTNFNSKVSAPKIKWLFPSNVAAKQIQEQNQKVRQAKMNAEDAERQERLDEQQRQRERQKELISQQQEQKAELIRQQQRQREVLIRQNEILREQEKRRQDLYAQERERQSQLESQREEVRKQLEIGVEEMYKEALSLYNQGDYSQAADRFKDVQDIIPGYKRSSQFMDEARMKTMTTQPQAPIASNENQASPNGTAPTSVSHQDDVSKALDLFDPNAK